MLSLSLTGLIIPFSSLLFQMHCKQIHLILFKSEQRFQLPVSFLPTAYIYFKHLCTFPFILHLSFFISILSIVDWHLMWSIIMKVRSSNSAAYPSNLWCDPVCVIKPQ